MRWMCADVGSRHSSSRDVFAQRRERELPEKTGPTDRSRFAPTNAESKNETLACGTGVVASALIFAATENVDGPIGVLVRGGDELEVGFEKSGERISRT